MTRLRPLEGRRILVLEDDYYLAQDEKALLEQAGAIVVGPFGTAVRMDEIAAVPDLDGAVMDINLGRGPSFAFAWLMRGRSVPFLFVTGYDAAVIPSELSDVERVEKPIRPKDFIAAVARLDEISARARRRAPG